VERTVINAGEIIAAAHARTGLAELQEPAILEGLEIYVRSLNEQARLTRRGAENICGSLVSTLANRLRVDDYLRRLPELLDEPVQKPMFVFGLPRTGTTLAINLLNEDPARRCLLRWEALDSVPPPRAQALSSDPRCRREQARLDAVVKHAPQIAAIHYEDADSPTECQYVMAQSFCAQLFEAQVDAPSYRSWWLQASYRPAFRHHKRFLQLLQSEAPGRWTLKNPWHALYLDDLIAVYPDAQLIMTHRNPVEVVGSFCSLIETVRATFSDAVDLRRIGEDALDTFSEMIRRCDTFRRRHGHEAIHDLQYAELMADPIGQMRTIYRRFGEPWTQAAEQAMTERLAKNPQGRFGQHSYSLEAYGLSSGAVLERFQNYCRGFDLMPRRADLGYSKEKTQ
jgi:hypothetical protein